MSSAEPLAVAPSRGARAAGAPAPGAPATVLWLGEGVAVDAGHHLYPVLGPVLEAPLAGDLFLLAPGRRDAIAERLYAGAVGVEELRAFLAECRLARGELLDEGAAVRVGVEWPVLALVEAGAAAGVPRLGYLEDIGAFLLDERPLYVSAEAVAAARAGEAFALASVCDSCGRADDAAVFVWTARGPDDQAPVRVRLLLENDAGLWTCRLHPFEFACG
jgi:hypothetical protein